MRSVVETLTKILADIEAKLPKLLSEHGAGQFEGYSIGYPIDREQKIQLCVRFAESSDNANKSFTFDIHAHIPGVTEIDSYKYMDAVNEYIDKEFDPQIAGYTDGSYAVAMSDNFKLTIISQYWSVTLTYPKDDCDL